MIDGEESKAKGLFKESQLEISQYWQGLVYDLWRWPLANETIGEC